MNDRLFASIITCVRNQSPDFFQECARSVATLGREIEWIIVDDGSSALSRTQHFKIVSDLSRTITTRFITSEHVGLSAARNIGLNLATGEWIIVLDSDDFLSPQILEHLKAVSPASDLVCFDTIYFSTTKSEYRPIRRFAEQFDRFGCGILDPFLWYDFYYHGVIVKRSVLSEVGGYRSDLPLGEDQDVLLRTVEAVGRRRIGFVSEVGYYYRENKDGVCHKRWKDVVANYTLTMLEGSQRRGAPFVACRFAGAQSIDGACVDAYEYQTSYGRWVTWEQWAEMSTKWIPNSSNS
jgi:glycosyltransferase involved in cell wall biosynthesis